MTVDEYDLDKWSLHYAPLLFNEYIACVIATKAVTPQFKNMLENWQDGFSEQQIDNLMRRKFAYDFHFREVMACFWLVLVQLAKLLGHHQEDANFPLIKFIDKFEDEEIENQYLSIIKDLDLTLKELLENYPQIPDDQSITEKLTLVFERLAAIYNFYFEDSESNLEDDEKH